MGNVDVVVPCYNYASYLRCCVESVLSQDKVHVRVLIIDDASSDDTAAVAQSIAENDARVTFRLHPVNCGHVATYNEGIDWADADYFLLLSADDWLVPGALARAVAILDVHPEVVLTHGRAEVAYDGSSPELTPEKFTAEYHVEPGQSFIEKSCANAASSPVWTPTAIVRTSVQKQIGGYDRSLPQTCDLEMWLRFACHGSIARLNAWQAIYRKHDLNMHYTYSNVANLREHYLAFQSAFTKDGSRIAHRDRLECEYKRALARGAVREAGRTESGSTWRDHLSFAQQIFPEVVRTRLWYRVRLKRLIGYRTLMPRLRRILGLPVQSS